MRPPEITGFKGISQYLHRFVLSSRHLFSIISTAKTVHTNQTPNAIAVTSYEFSSITLVPFPYQAVTVIR